MTATARDARSLLTSAASADDVQALLAVEHLATLSAYTDDELALDLMRARRLPGCAGMVDVLRTMIRATRKAAPPPLREAREPEGASLVDWLRAHDCPWMPDGDADIPAPYLLADDAVQDRKSVV